MSKPTLAWAMPMYGSVHRLVYESHMTAMGSLAKEGIVVTPKFVIVSNKMGLASASNKITQAILDQKPDYIFWTEMDMVLPAYTVTRLLKHAQQYNIDVLSGVYFLRGSGQPCLFKKVLEEKENPFYHTQMGTFPKNAIFEVGCPGVGCVLFKREVFEQLEFPYWDDRQGRCGQDIYFYTKLREKGIKVYADSSVICDQIDEDEPKLWTSKEYEEWLRKEGGHRSGFLQDDTKSIKLNDVESR